MVFHSDLRMMHLAHARSFDFSYSLVEVHLLSLCCTLPFLHLGFLSQSQGISIGFDSYWALLLPALVGTPNIVQDSTLAKLTYPDNVKATLLTFLSITQNPHQCPNLISYWLKRKENCQLNLHDNYDILCYAIPIWQDVFSNLQILLHHLLCFLFLLIFFLSQPFLEN